MAETENPFAKRLRERVDAEMKKRFGRTGREGDAAPAGEAASVTVTPRRKIVAAPASATSAAGATPKTPPTVAKPKSALDSALEAASDTSASALRLQEAKEKADAARREADAREATIERVRPMVVMQMGDNPDQLWTAEISSRGHEGDGVLGPNRFKTVDTLPDRINHDREMYLATDDGKFIKLTRLEPEAAKNMNAYRADMEKSGMRFGAVSFTPAESSPYDNLPDGVVKVDRKSFAPTKSKVDGQPMVPDIMIPREVAAISAGTTSVATVAPHKLKDESAKRYSTPAEARAGLERSMSTAYVTDTTGIKGQAEGREVRFSRDEIVQQMGLTTVPPRMERGKLVPAQVNFTLPTQGMPDHMRMEVTEQVRRDGERVVRVRFKDESRNGNRGDSTTRAFAQDFDVVVPIGADVQIDVKQNSAGKVKFDLARPAYGDSQGRVIVRNDRQRTVDFAHDIHAASVTGGRFALSEPRQRGEDGAVIPTENDMRLSSNLSEQDRRAQEAQEALAVATAKREAKVDSSRVRDKAVVMQRKCRNAYNTSVLEQMDGQVAGMYQQAAAARQQRLAAILASAGYTPGAIPGMGIGPVVTEAPAVPGMGIGHVAAPVAHGAPGMGIPHIPAGAAPGMPGMGIPYSPAGGLPGMPGMGIGTMGYSPFGGTLAPGGAMPSAGDLAIAMIRTGGTGILPMVASYGGAVPFGAGETPSPGGLPGVRPGTGGRGGRGGGGGPTGA